MANQRPAHRRGTTGQTYRKLQARVFASSDTCARCHNSRGPIVRQPCDPTRHPSHAKLDYCPTHTLAPSLGHKKDLQHGGKTTWANSQLEHYGCNASAGVKSRYGRDTGAHKAPTSWDW